MTSPPAPFNNCEFKICDLRGQCIGEGKCHHPIKPTDESSRTITDQAATIAQLQIDNERMREACEAMFNDWAKNSTANMTTKTRRLALKALATQPTLAERGYKDIKYLACSKCGVMPDEAIATRLRRVCTILKLTSAVPDDDLELYRSMFSVLGIIARKLEPQPAEYNPLNEGK